MRNNPSNASMPKTTCRLLSVIGRLGLSGRGLRGIPWLLVPMLLSMPARTQDAKQDVRNNTGQMTANVESPQKYAGILYKSENRRDPFLNPLLLKKNVKPDDEELTRGLPPPGIAGTYIAQASLQGTSIRNEQRVAILRGADTRAYFLREGDRLFDGYLKSIQDDSVTLVRETKMRSGKILTQDVTKRLRTP
jgi:Tfp pilus assembly protein PilP